jgi:hypothetical protein
MGDGRGGLGPCKNFLQIDTCAGPLALFPDGVQSRVSHRKRIHQISGITKRKPDRGGGFIL